MRALVVRTAVATIAAAGLLLGSAGTAAADDQTTTGSVAPASLSTPDEPGPSEETPETTSVAPTSTTTTTSTSSDSSTSEETTTPSMSTTSEETTTSEEATTSGEAATSSTSSAAPVEQPGTSALASRGCLGEIAVVVTIPDLEAGTPVTVVVDGRSTPAEVLEGGRIVVGTFGLAADLAVVDVAVQDGDAVHEVQVPVADVCTATGTIGLVRDCATPDQVLATVDVTGLADGVHGISVLGATGSGRVVVLAGVDVDVSGGRLTGTLPLLGVGPGPAEGFVGIALVVDGTTFASVAGSDVELASCVVPAPLPAAPAAPTAAPVVSTSSAAPTSSGAAHPVSGQLATTGSETGSLLVLSGVLLLLGVTTTLVARRAARS